MSLIAKVGALLSRHLKEMSLQKDESGKTNAELLSETIWKLALGKGRPAVNKFGQVLMPKPDREMIVLLFDRLEGRVGDAETTNKRITDIPDHVYSVTVEKLNKMSRAE